jgi:hypothetical protein
MNFKPGDKVWFISASMTGSGRINMTQQNHLWIDNLIINGKRHPVPESLVCWSRDCVFLIQTLSPVERLALGVPDDV